MRSNNLVVAGWLLCLACSLTGLSAIASGGDFRIDTELFENEDKQPFLETLTIFAEGVAYDFRLTEPKEASVFDPVHGRFTLLDESRRVKATVTTQELLDFSLSLETHAAQAKEPLFAFCALPQFETSEKEVEQNGQTLTELQLAAKPLSYVARGQKPPHPDAVKAYHQFADWCARLNATRSGNLPPGARLALNQALAERKLLPLEITRTIFATGTFSKNKKLDTRSQHRVNWALSGEDRKKIDRAGDMMATFEQVSYDDYRSAPAKPSGKQARR
jgi:hypothetical protein